MSIIFQLNTNFFVHVMFLILKLYCYVFACFKHIACNIFLFIINHHLNSIFLFIRKFIYFLLLLYYFAAKGIINLSNDSYFYNKSIKNIFVMKKWCHLKLTRLLVKSESSIKYLINQMFIFICILLIFFICIWKVVS